MSLEINPGRQGATRQGWRKKGHRELVRELVVGSPTESESRLFEIFVARCREDENYLISALEYAWTNAYHSINAQLELEKDPVKVVRERAKRAETREKIAKEIAAKVLILNLEMPNGKKLRYCTGEECATFGGAFLKIAQKVGKNKLVGQTLTEAQVRKLFN